MLDFWPLRSQHGGDDQHELSFSRQAGRATKAQEDADGTLPLFTYPYRRRNTFTVFLAAFATLVAVLFLVSRCVVVLSRNDGLRSSTARRLAHNANTIYVDLTSGTFGRLCLPSVFGDGTDTSRPTRGVQSPEPSNPSVDRKKRKNDTGCSVRRKRKRDVDSYGSSTEGNDEHGVGRQTKTMEPGDLQILPSTLLTLNDLQLHKAQGGTSGLDQNQFLDQYIDEALAADEGSLTLDAWLVDPAGELPASPSSSALQPISVESSEGVHDDKAAFHGVASARFEGGTSHSAIREQPSLQWLTGPAGPSFQPLEASFSPEALNFLQPGLQPPSWQILNGQQHSQVVNNQQQPMHTLDEYIDQALATDEASLSLDAWLLDPVGEVPASLVPVSLQQRSDESFDDVKHEQAMLSAVAPSMLEDGTSLSALEPKTFLRMDEGPSGLSFPPLEPNLSSETFSVPQPGTFASQANNGQQHSHRVENQQQLVQFHSDEQMKGQGGNSGYPIYIPKMTPEKDITTHPFYRLPRVVPGAFVRGFREAKLDRMAARRFNSLNSMVLVKECLKMPVIDWQHLDVLMTQVEFLAGFAIVQMRGDIDKKKPKVAVERLAFALILVDSLYAATEVWGPQSRRDEWWGSVVSAIPVYPGPTKVAASRPTAEQNILLAQSLQSALDTYRSGKRPTAEVLVSLKQKIFCTRQIPRFQRGQWLKWRTDDLEWRGSL